LLNYNDGIQNKKGRTITFRVDDGVAEGSAGNAGKGTRIGYMKKKLVLVLLMLQILLGGCGDDDPTDEWVGMWTLKTRNKKRH